MLLLLVFDLLLKNFCVFFQFFQLNIVLFIELCDLGLIIRFSFLQSFKVYILCERLLRGFQKRWLIFLALLFGVVRKYFPDVYRLKLTFIEVRLLLTFPISNALVIVGGDDIEDLLSALFVVEDVFLEVVDGGVFGREEFSFRVVCDPPKCVSQIIVCSDRVPELIKSVCDEAEQEVPLLLVMD